MEMSWLLLIGGLIVLSLGADLLVRGASHLSLRFGVSPLVVGLTIVSFGTSAPEFAVSIGAALNGNTGLALGNAVGSNIFNIFVVLGTCALFATLKVHRQVVLWDIPVMLAGSFLFFLFALDGGLSRIESGFLFFCFLAINYLSFKLSGEAPTDELPKKIWKPLVSILVFVTGFLFLVFGSRWFVEGAVEIAQSFGVSDLLIGLTIVSVGTSLPELAASVAAVLKGEVDMAVGNVVGSNLFNILGVMGLTGMISPVGIPAPVEALVFDIPVMLAAALICLPIVFKGYQVNRWEGFLFLGFYVLYITLLSLNGAGHSEAYKSLLTSARLIFVPGALVFIFLSFYREVRVRMRTEGQNEP